MKTGYVTDSFSTLGGLASVAYGDPEYFREVQNQIYAQSPTRFLDSQRPSDVFSSFVWSRSRLSEILLDSLNLQYSTDSDFANYVDIKFGPAWREELIGSIDKAFFEILDSEERYGLSFRDYVGLAVSRLISDPDVSERVALGAYQKATQDPLIGPDVSLMSRVVSNNPQTKLSIPPLNSRVDLSNTVDLGYDFRGVNIPTGYISPQDYWSDIAIPGLTTSSLPPDIQDYISDGYVGYSSRTPLESLYNPVGALSVSDAPGTATPSFEYNQFSDELQGDKDVFSISLMGERLNGYTTFDPATMSNGDLMDTSQVPNFEEDNKDPQGGLNSAARNFTPAF